MNEPISWDQAIIDGKKLINDQCDKEGIPGLTGCDIAILAAHRAGESAFLKVKALNGHKPEFNDQAAQFAAKCIAQAILSKK